MSDLDVLERQIRAGRRRDPLLPLGQPGVSHRWRPRRPRAVLRVAAGAVGVVATAVGLLLAAMPAAPTLRVDANSYRVGDGLLRATGNGRYTGDAALVVGSTTNGVTRAAADAVVRGRDESGICVMSVSQLEERCLFVAGASTVSAVDRWTGTGWNRRYDDGVTVTIPANSMVPLPFEVER
jgi:hypothetical protein